MTNQSSELVQVIQSPEPPTLESVTVAESFHSTVEALRKIPIDLAKTPPVRWTVVEDSRNRTGRAWLVATVHHLGAGHRGRLLLKEELEQSLNLPDGIPGLPLADSPRCLASRDGSARGLQLAVNARTRLRGMLKEVRSKPFPVREACAAAPTSERVAAELVSSSLSASLAVLARRWRVPASSILLAGLSTTMAPIASEGCPLAWRVLNDRAGKSARPLFSYEPWNAVVPVDPSIGGMERLTTTTWQEMLRGMANWHGGDMVLANDLRREADRRRVVSVELPLWLNFRRFTTPAQQSNRLELQSRAPTPGAEVAVIARLHPDCAIILIQAHRALISATTVLALLADLEGRLSSISGT